MRNGPLIADLAGDLAGDLAVDLAGYGSRLAVVDASGAATTYEQLAERVADTAHRLGLDRRLVLVEAANELEPLVTYLGALSAGHPVLLTAPGGRHTGALVHTYDPDVVLRRGPSGDGWRLTQRRDGSAHTLHTELAVLLSTSGSTGSPKLVRLSAGNLRANAESIATYLDIRGTDRACAALPMHYCYGLSVVNSNLLRGAALLLTDDSVLEPRFWRLFREHGGTSLHGVPHTFELLDRIGFDGWELPSLRYVTQAGGALAPERVRKLAQLGERRGWRLFVMYGQTEATARMAYLPPELAASHPDAIGVPIPGGSLEILPTDVPGQGELVYRGPNVMLGYATAPADLALGRTVDALHTGDLASRDPDGLYRVVGRTSRSIKLSGLRIDLDQAERLLAGRGHRVACTGGDDVLIVATPSTDHAPILDAVRQEIGLPATHVRVLTVDPLPRLPSGKVDYPRLRELAEAPPTGPARDSSMRAVFATVLGHRDVADSDTFVRLGGDSLSYVRMSVELERAIGHLPRDWPTTPVAELGRLVASPRRARSSTLETNILLRAVAITLVVGSHIGVFDLLGGAHLLLIIAGWSFARFSLEHPARTRSGAILRSAARIAIPSMIWLVSRIALGTEVGLTNVALIDVYARRGAVGFWFIEVLVHILLLFGLLFAIPALGRLEQRCRFGFPLACLAVALLVQRAAHTTPTFYERINATHGVLWFFVLGWLAQRATTTQQKLVVAAVALLMLPGYFDNPRREAIVLAGLAMLLLVSRLRLARPLVRVAGPTASASLAIYLTHYAVLDIVRGRLPGPLTLAICLALGITVWYLLERSRHLIGATTPRIRTPSEHRDPPQPAGIPMLRRAGSRNPSTVHRPAARPPGHGHGRGRAAAHRIDGPHHRHRPAASARAPLPAGVLRRAGAAFRRRLRPSP